MQTKLERPPLPPSPQPRNHQATPAPAVEHEDGLTDDAQPASGKLDDIFTKVNNVEASLTKQAAERKGTGLAAGVAVLAAILYVGSTYWFPNAGKQQRPIAVEFTSMSINQSTLQNTYNQNLHQLLSELPNPNTAAQKFSSNTADLANKIILVNANVTNSAKLALSVSSFLPIILDDYQAQKGAGALTPEQEKKLQQTFKVLGQTSEELVTCKKNLDGETAAYYAATKNNASPDVKAQALIQMTTTLTGLIRNQSEMMKCMQMVDRFTATFPQVEQIHDDGIVGFNQRAESDAKWLAACRSIAGMLLFFVGNPTRSFIQSQWARFAKKDKEK